jgi:hypothetical protein
LLIRSWPLAMGFDALRSSSGCVPSPVAGTGLNPVGAERLGGQHLTHPPWMVNPVGCRALVRSEMGARALAFKSSAIFCGESTPTVTGASWKGDGASRHGVQLTGSPPWSGRQIGKVAWFSPRTLCGFDARPLCSWCVSSDGRTPVSQTGGQGFEPPTHYSMRCSSDGRAGGC